MGSIEYGIRRPSSGFDRRPVDQNGKGDVAVMKGKKLGEGSKGNAATQSKKQGIGRGQ